MEKVTPTAARIVKKGFWKDINRWIEEEYNQYFISIDQASKKKILSVGLKAARHCEGDFYAGAILVKNQRFPSKNQLYLFGWDAYVESKRVVINPTRYDNRLRDEVLSGIAFTEHSIEQMATRLNTLNRHDIMQELVAAAMPALSLILGFFGSYPVEDTYYALKTPRGIGVLAINHIKDIEVAGYLVTWISNEEANAPKYQQILWQALPRRTRGSGVLITIDIPSGIKLYFPHELSPEWVRSVMIDH